MNRKSGYFLVFRDVWKHPAFRNLVEASIWLYMISSATHKSKKLKFMDNEIQVNLGDLIFPIRKNAKIWNISYTSLRSFLLRLKRRKMISIKVIKLRPAPNHKYGSVTVINISNYSRFQYNEEFSNQQVINDYAYTNTLTNTITNISNDYKKDKSSKEIKYTGNSYANYDEIVINGKKKWKHKFKQDAPLVDHP